MIKPKVGYWIYVIDDKILPDKSKTYGIITSIDSEPRRINLLVKKWGDGTSIIKNEDDTYFVDIGRDMYIVAETFKVLKQLMMVANL